MQGARESRNSRDAEQTAQHDCSLYRDSISNDFWGTCVQRMNVPNRFDSTQNRFGRSPVELILGAAVGQLTGLTTQLNQIRVDQCKYRT